MSKVCKVAKFEAINKKKAATMAIIKNYGFLWERKYFYRGKGGRSGHLKGVSKGQTVDFREQIGVYVLYDRNQSIVYVGQAGNGNATLFTRMKNHLDGALWNRWEYFTWLGFRDSKKGGLSLSDRQSVDSAVSGFKYSDALDEIEGVLIEVLEPRLNKQGGKLKNATEYFQVIDEQMVDVSNHELLEEIKSLNTQVGLLKKTNKQV